MTFADRIHTMLQTFHLASHDQELVERLLKDFENSSPLEKEAARPAAIEKLFPLVFGENAAISSSTTFDELKKKPWSTNCHLTPIVILTPRTPCDISNIMSLCRILGAKFSIRCGGHLHNPGFSSNHGGVVISMSKFTSISLSDDKSIAKIGAGLTWLEVYSALEEEDATVTGGRVPPIGVSGLLLGGGLSFQNSEHGFSCMGVENYEVVLADGSIKNANKTENSALFWALKGGCSNFGIVTRFDMTVIPNKVWAEARIYPPTANEQLLKALMIYHEEMEKDNKATIVMQVMEQATLLIFFSGAPVEKPEVFNCFYDIPFLMHVIPPACSTVAGVMQGIANVLAPGPQMHDVRMTASLPDLEMYNEAEKARLQQIEALEVQGLKDVKITMVFQPIASSTMKASDDKGGNPMGIDSQNHQYWKGPNDEEAVRAACKVIIDKCEEVSKKNGTYLPFKYANYSSRDQNPLSNYGEKNLKKLKEIALKYDPEGVFQTLQSGGWLVSKT